jgi:hypothetical protein
MIVEKRAERLRVQSSRRKKGVYRGLSRTKRTQRR